MQRSTIFDAIKSHYEDCLDPLVIDANILHENNLVYLEVIKSAGGNDLVVYKYALKDWNVGKLYTSNELGLSSREEFSREAKEFAHLSLPLFDVSNSLEVSVDQFVDLFLMEKNALLNLTELFID